MRILGLDIGDKRIGVAVSDEKEVLSTPVEVIDNNERTAELLEKIIDKYNVKKIIVGMPYTLRGEVGSQAKKVIGFIDNVVKKIGVEVNYVDERYTSKIPLKYFKKNKRKKDIDKYSAGIILQDYLNRDKRNDKKKNN
jgi:putative holliday junction resolvase